MAQSLGSPVADEVKPYRIHIPTKHLELTRQKLELTGLPHEPSHPSADTWAPKPLIESLIDYWYDPLSRSQRDEHHPDTAAGSSPTPGAPAKPVSTPPPPSPSSAPQSPRPAKSPRSRIHFIHARSPHQNAIPLLLVPPFPLPNLSLQPLIQPLTFPAAAAPPDTSHNTNEASAQQAFHVVIPSFPGTAFSDPLPAFGSSLPAVDNSDKTTTTNPVSATAAVFDALMTRLGYKTYLASTAAPGWMGAERVDGRVVKQLVGEHHMTCVGGHLISPELTAPTLGRDGVVDWGRWVVARAMKGGMGYEKGDFEALAVSPRSGVGGSGGGREGGRMGKVKDGCWRGEEQAWGDWAR
ncbi:hypothetical protein VTI74DRAFT_1998 [Chaetomium olivicolor]